MTTKQAFSELISKRKWYADTGISQEAANLVAKRFRDGAQVSTDKIEEILEKAGYKTVVGPAVGTQARRLVRQRTNRGS
jgi:hypothetical protein